TFLYVLLFRSDTTIGQFVDLANAAFAYLALRSGLGPGEHARWASKLDPKLPLLAADQPTLLEIIEASARARELTNLEIWRVAQSTIDNWRGRSIFGVYAPAFNVLMSELGSPAWAKAATDIALSTPMDIAAGDAGDVLYVDEVLPSHRLGKIVAGLR